MPSKIAKRVFDLIASAIAIMVLLPLFFFAAMIVFCADGLPVIFKSSRVGLRGINFTLYKFRTMRTVTLGEKLPVITSVNDTRVFRGGNILRKCKLDELPQLFNIFFGSMSVVGPRPESPKIVAEAYNDFAFETLSVKPGLSSPGSIWYYTHGEKLLTEADSVDFYVGTVLPIKLALDRVYIQNKNLNYDTRIIFRTIFVIIGTFLGKKNFKDPPELKDAMKLLKSDVVNT